MLLGQLSPESGSVKLGTNLQVVYLDKLRGQIDNAKTVAQNVAGDAETVTFQGRPRHIHSYLQDFLFRADTGTVQHAIAATKASVSGKFVTYHDPGVLLVTISGGDVHAARKIVDDALVQIRKPLDRATFNAARSAFFYHMLSDIQTPGGMADTLGWYGVEGNPAYAPGAGGAGGRYFAAVNALTPDFVALTVNKYLSRPAAAVAVDVKKTDKATQ